MHDASLFGAIASAKTTAIDAIDNAANVVAVNSALSTGKVNVNSAISAYDNSIGLIKF